ncbi:pyridoxal phosphate-dependent aminotransferase [Patescibacteria group bacterium]
MPELSSRAANMPASPLRKLANAAEDRKKAGTKVYHLNIGQPDMTTPEEFFEGLKSINTCPIEYAMSQGAAEAIDAWREYYAGIDINLDKDELMITTGGSEALIFAFCSVADPGDNIIVFEPFYTNYNGFGQIGGVEMKPVTCSIEDGFHLPADEVVEAAIDDKTRAMIICNPSNPTGTVYSKEELKRMVDLAIKHNLFIIADEVYREFGFEEDVTSLMLFPEAADRVILVDSASKRFNACGIRIGILASHNKDIVTASVKYGMARLSVATIEQMALIPVLKKWDELIPPVVEEYRKRRDVVYEGLIAIEGVKTSKPEGAFYIVCELPVDSSENFAQWMIEEFEHEGETVLVAPAPGFYATPGMGEKEIRIAYVLNCEDLQRALELLKLAIEQYNSK